MFLDHLCLVLLHLYVVWVVLICCCVLFLVGDFVSADLGCAIAQLLVPVQNRFVTGYRTMSAGLRCAIARLLIPVHDSFVTVYVS